LRVKDLTPHAAVSLAVQLKNNATKVVAVAVLTAARAKCTLPFVQRVVLKLKYRSSLMVVSLFTAVSASRKTTLWLKTIRKKRKLNVIKSTLKNFASVPLVEAALVALAEDRSKAAMMVTAQITLQMKVKLKKSQVPLKLATS
jgi:hypothetical protein